MVKSIILTTELELEKTIEEDGAFFFVSKSLSKDFECEKGRSILSRESKNKPLIWRHKHPLQSKNSETHIYGAVVDSWLEDGEIYSKYRVYDHTEEHKVIIDVIKERHKIGKPLGISMRYRKYLKDGVPIHYDVFEHSGTPYPKCNDCKELKFGVETMTNEEQKTKKETELEKALKKISELEEILNSKTEIVNELKLKTETLEKEMKVKEAELENKEVVEKTLEEKVIDLKNSIELLKKKPIMDKILEVKKLDKLELGFYEEQSIDYLEEKYKEFEKESISSKIEVQNQEQSSEDAQKAGDEELEKKEPTFEEFTKLTNIKIKKEE